MDNKFRLKRLSKNSSKVANTLDEILKTFENYDDIIRGKDEEIKKLQQCLKVEPLRLQSSSMNINHFFRNSKLKKVATIIWSYLDRKSLRSCRLVAKLWNKSVLQNFDIFWAFDEESGDDYIQQNNFVNELCRTGQTETMELLLPALIKMKYPINQEKLFICADGGGLLAQEPVNPLSHACLNGHFDLAKLLIDHGKQLKLNINHIYERQDNVSQRPLGLR